MSKKFFSRASLVCGASLVVVASVLVGCSRSGSEKEGARAPAVDHMRDPKLKAQLADQRAERDALVRAKHTIVEKMEAVAKKYNGDLKAASQDPEMIQLIQRARDIETNFKSNRAHSAEMIRATVRPNANTKNALKKEVK